MALTKRASKDFYKKVTQSALCLQREGRTWAFRRFGPLQSVADDGAPAAAPFLRLEWSAVSRRWWPTGPSRTAEPPAALTEALTRAGLRGAVVAGPRLVVAGPPPTQLRPALDAVVALAGWADATRHEAAPPPPGSMRAVPRQG